MKKTIAAFLAGAALSGVALPACAEAFKNEISLYGSWQDINEPTDSEQATVDLRYGRFVTPQIVATAGLLYSRFKGPTIDATSGALSIGAKYYIQEPRLKALAPFLDVSVGIARTDDGRSSSDDFTWAFGGGVAYFLTESTSLDAAIRLFQTNTDIETKGSRIQFGITTRF
jgi:opacity protein-like surface antigen